MKSPFVLIGIFVGVAIIGIFWTWPAYQNFAKLKTEEQQLRVQTQTRENYFHTLTNVQAQLQSSKDKLAKIDAAFPNESDLPALYQEIQQMAASSGLVLKTVSAASSFSQSGQSLLAPIEVNAALSGSYGSVKEFLSRSQIVSRVLDVQSIGFFSPLKANTVFDVNIKLNAYSY